MTIKCVVACRNANGEPDFFALILSCSQAAIAAGGHYEEAIAQAEAGAYEGPFVVFDENDGPNWLFEHCFPATVVYSVLRNEESRRVFLGTYKTVQGAEKAIKEDRTHLEDSHEREAYDVIEGHLED